ncbi:protein DOG1-like 3 [Impatiens glandulifera]|uniref:protein DOG1-like 3 n=1 Tax=Impatiens glandulifera TaxID=253017 RepID=UPI001FB0F648|nr:protein DOG1-like 3 [Impatiens glandulifera]
MMSLPPNSSVYVEQGVRNGFTHQETFQNFFECWLIEQNQRLQDLVSAAESYQLQNQNQFERESALHELINQVIHHYEHYYSAKSHWVKEDVLSMLSPSWRTTLENAFLWIGGWRPSMAFHLLYSKSGIQLEAALSDFLRGLPTADLGEFSPDQIMQVDELHLRTIGEEREITEKLAKRQQTVADPSMVELSHAVSEMMRDESGSSSGIVEQERVDTVIGEKERGLEEILQIADELRMRTLKGVIEILSPIEVVHFLIAAAELHLRMHDWGKKKEARHNQEEEVQPNGVEEEVLQNGVEVSS